jgi:hypothetical protein
VTQFSAQGLDPIDGFEAEGVDAGGRRRTKLARELVE